jgi:hypothetical protein
MPLGIGHCSVGIGNCSVGIDNCYVRIAHRSVGKELSLYRNKALLRREMV